MNLSYFFIFKSYFIIYEINLNVIFLFYFINLSYLLNFFNIFNKFFKKIVCKQ